MLADKGSSCMGKRNMACEVLAYYILMLETPILIQMNCKTVSYVITKLNFIYHVLLLYCIYKNLYIF